MARNIMQYHNYQHQYQDVSVLYVEDEKFSREKLLRVLRRRFTNIHVAFDGVEGLQLYQQYQPDILIADIKLNQMGGLEMIKKIRKINDNVQVIVTTAHDDNDFFIQSIENQVNHFILKPIDLERFLQAIQKSVYQVHQQKTVDPLTNSYNRVKFEEILEIEMSRADRFDHPFSIIMMDIDFFKNVNDRFGHHEGDNVLITISTIVHQRIRECDMFARWGVEAFILLTPETNGQGALILADSIRSLTEGYYFKNIGNLTCSFGVAEFSPGKSKSELILEAEQALNRSKNKGRNCVTIYTRET